MGNGRGGGLACAAIVGWQCSIYDSSLLTQADSSDAAAPSVYADTPDGGGSDAGAKGADTCNHARWPDRPAGLDNGTSGPEILQAIRMFNFGPDQTEAGAPLGFDLDGVCTWCSDTSSGPEACVPFKTSSPQCDLSGGRDNSAGELLAKLSSLSETSFGTAGINKRLQAGLCGVVLRLRNYDGTPNDPRVELSVYISNGPDGDSADADAGAGGDAGSRPTILPKFDGTDRWSVQQQTLSLEARSFWVPTAPATPTCVHPCSSTRRRMSPTTKSSRISIFRCRSARAASRAW